MTDIPTLAEQYSDALAVGQPRDVVGAAGYAGRIERLGYLLWRVLHGGDIASVIPLRDTFYLAIQERARRKNWWQPAEAAEIHGLADRVLRWYLINVCHRCQGRRYEPVPGVARVLSDKPCPACHGYGRLAIETAVPVGRVGRAKELAGILDLADQRMIDATRRARYES